MTGSAAIADRAGKWRGLKRALIAAVALLIAAPVLFGAGFLWFVLRMPTDEVALDRSADGIVVLTGGASRILDAVELLAAGRGKRLLISGVHRGTTSLPPDVPVAMNYNDNVWFACAALALQTAIMLGLAAWFLRRKDVRKN